MDSNEIPLDCLIFGGGVAGLFTLDSCLASGFRTLLLESKSLGTGQTIDSQGIIHGGIKYALTGKSSSSATAIRDMPMVWRRCLAGESTPDLTNVVMRSEYCHIWRTDSIASKLGWFAAKVALRIKPTTLEDHERPAAFDGINGSVARLDEQVVEPRSLLEVLHHAHCSEILQIDSSGMEIVQRDGRWVIKLLNPENGEPMDLVPKKIILTAGKGNQVLRQLFGLTTDKSQSRPLHMVMVRGKLPIINGHCIDGAKTRVSITTTTDYASRQVWQVGGQLSEDGVQMSQEELICHSAKELNAVLPNVELDKMEFTTYCTTRAECNTGGSRPSDISIVEDGDVLTCWPTKLAFAPRLADAIVSRLGSPEYHEPIASRLLSSWPTPTVALPPWETDQPWTPLEIACLK